MNPSDKTPEELFPHDCDAIADARAAYRECVEANIRIFKKHGLTMLNKDQVEGIAYSVQDTLCDYVKSSIRTLEDAGFYDTDIEGYDHKIFLERMYYLLKSGKEGENSTITFNGGVYANAHQNAGGIVSVVRDSDHGWHEADRDSIPVAINTGMSAQVLEFRP